MTMRTTTLSHALLAVLMAAAIGACNKDPAKEKASQQRKQWQDAFGVARDRYKAGDFGGAIRRLEDVQMMYPGTPGAAKADPMILLCKAHLAAGQGQYARADAFATAAEKARRPLTRSDDTAIAQWAEGFAEDLSAFHRYRGSTNKAQQKIEAYRALLNAGRHAEADKALAELSALRSSVPEPLQRRIRQLEREGAKARFFRDYRAAMLAGTTALDEGRLPRAREAYLRALQLLDTTGKGLLTEIQHRQFRRDVQARLKAAAQGRP